MNENNEKKIDIEDPRLTAYLLNELNAEEKADLEQQIANNPELAQAVADLEVTISAIRQALQNEPLPETSSTKTDLASNVNPDSKAGQSPISFTPLSNEIHSPERKTRWIYNSVISITAVVFIAAAAMFYINSGKRNNINLARSENKTPQIQSVYNRPAVDTDSSVMKEMGQENKDISKKDSGSTQESVKMKKRSSTTESNLKTDSKPKTESKQEVSEQKTPISPPTPKASNASNAKPTDHKPSPDKASANSKSNAPMEVDPYVERSAPPQISASTTQNAYAGRAVMSPSMSSSPPMSAFGIFDTLGKDTSEKTREISRRSVEKRTDSSSWESPVNSQATNMNFRAYTAPDNEGYTKITEKPFVTPKENPFSTFSIDVDTASWSNIRRYLTAGRRPPEDAVKIEEIVNYFKYDYKAPDEKSKDPFAVHTETAPCPWCTDHLLVKIGIKGKEIKLEKRPPLNLVFLIDTSGSMYSENKLPLVKKSLTELTEMLTNKDRIAIVTYGSDAHVALESVSGTETAHILDIVNGLQARGSTAGAAGITTAYEIARKQFDKAAANRVILCTDGDFNVGTTNNQDLEKMIEKEAKSGVYLSILGFGMGNYKDDRLAILSNKGNGNYGYIDSLDEAQRLLVEKLTGTLITIAKDVKIQIDFNPNRVAGYRLLGYEDRHLAAQDFNNDKKDAGEIGAGHTVTALYEIVPVGVDLPNSGRIDSSRYTELQKPDDKKSDDKKSDDKKSDKKNNDVKSNSPKTDIAASSKQINEELMFVKIRYKNPDAVKSTLMTKPVLFKKDSKAAMSSDFKFACAAALFGLVLRNSDYIENAGLSEVLELSKESVGNNKDRKEFVELVKKALANESAVR